MAGKPKSTTRILPTATPDDPFPSYPHNGGYRFIKRGADGAEEKSETFPTRARAAQARREWQQVIDGIATLTITEALLPYDTFLAESGFQGDGWKPGPRKEHLAAVRRMFPAGDELVAALDSKKKCEGLYEDLRRRRTPRSVLRCKLANVQSPLGDHEMGAKGCRCRVYSNTTQRNWLAQSRMFVKFCVLKGFCKENHMAAIDGIGRRKKGKRKLTVDEVRRWRTEAHLFASRGEEGAVAAMMAMFMGMRATEIVVRVARDIDDDCSKVRVEEIEGEEGEGEEEYWDPKTDAGWRTIVIPIEMRPYLVALKTGKADGASIWNEHHLRDWVNDWVGKICRAAGVRVITAHGARGTHNTLAVDGNERAARTEMAAGMGHTSFGRMTAPVYTDPNALARRTQRGFMKLIAGGK